MTEPLYKDESYRIMGACFEVYKEMGSGYLEAVYQECLKIEFAKQGIIFEEKKRLFLQYKGNTLEKWYETDFICFDKIILEIKAHKNLENGHRSQALHYLKATNFKLGLLVNFGHHPRLEHERYVNQG